MASRTSNNDDTLWGPCVLHPASTMDPPNSDEEQQFENECISAGVHVDLEENIEDEPMVTQIIEHTTRSGKRTIKINEHKPRKELRSSQMGDALQAWAEALKAKREVYLAKAERYRTKIVQTTNSTTSPADPSLTKCVDTLSQMEEISDDVYVAALEKFTNQDWREMFLAMPMERRKAWLNRLI